MAQQRITFEWILEESKIDFWRASEANHAGQNLYLSDRLQVPRKFVTIKTCHIHRILLKYAMNMEFLL